MIVDVVPTPTWIHWLVVIVGELVAICMCSDKLTGATCFALNFSTEWLEMVCDPNPIFWEMGHDIWSKNSIFAQLKSHTYALDLRVIVSIVIKGIVISLWYNRDDVMLHWRQCLNKVSTHTTLNAVLLYHIRLSDRHSHPDLPLSMDPPECFLQQFPSLHF